MRPDAVALPPPTAAFDEDAALAWLAGHADVRPPLELHRASGGHSAVTYLVEDAAGGRYVLQHPRRGEGPVHDVGRESRIHHALQRTDVPVPIPVAYCGDEAVAGAPFYVMRFVDGIVFDGAPVAERSCPPERRPDVAEEYVRALVAIHAVDVAAVGLGDLGRREGYVVRQLKRMYGLWQEAATREVPAIHELHDELARRVPPQTDVALVHGDYGLHNLIFSADFRLEAVVDWELATLGDPLADVALVTLAWIEPSDPPDAFAPDATRAPGFPTRADVLRRYEELSGRDLSRLPFYVAFANWRSACIREGLYARYLQRAEGVDTRLGSLLEGADRCLQAARDALGRDT